MFILLQCVHKTSPSAIYLPPSNPNIPDTIQYSLTRNGGKQLISRRSKCLSTLYIQKIKKRKSIHIIYMLFTPDNKFIYYNKISKNNIMHGIKKKLTPLNNLWNHSLIKYNFSSWHLKVKTIVLPQNFAWFIYIWKYTCTNVITIFILYFSF